MYKETKFRCKIQSAHYIVGANNFVVLRLYVDYVNSKIIIEHVNSTIATKNINVS